MNVEELKNDSKSFISNESQYYFIKLKNEENNENNKYADSSGEESELPDINFVDMFMKFYDLLDRKSMNNYTIEELDDFINYYTEKNKSNYLDDKKNNT
jgi:hypothetical protein